MNRKIRGRRNGAWLLLFVFTLSALNPACEAGEKGDVTALMKELKSPEVEKRVSAIYKLGEMGPEAAPAIPALILLLEDRQAVKRREGQYLVESNILTEAKRALVKIGPVSVEPLLKTFLDQQVYWVIRANAAEVLGVLHDERAVEPLIEFLKHKDDKAWDEYGFVADQTKNALEEITGQTYAKTGKNFGTDYAKWREWFDSAHTGK